MPLQRWQENTCHNNLSNELNFKRNCNAVKVLQNNGLNTSMRLPAVMHKKCQFQKVEYKAQDTGKRSNQAGIRLLHRQRRHTEIVTGMKGGVISEFQGS